MPLPVQRNSRDYLSRYPFAARQVVRCRLPYVRIEEKYIGPPNTKNAAGCELQNRVVLVPSHPQGNAGSEP